MEFFLQTQNPKVLKNMIEMLATIIDECDITITPEAFTIAAQDPSKIIFAYLTIPKKSFSEYICEKKQIVTINLTDLDKIMKRIIPKEVLEIGYSEDIAKIKIRMRKKNIGKFKTFSLSTLDITLDTYVIQKFLDIKYDSKICMDIKDMIDDIKNGEIYSDEIEIRTIKNKGIEFESSGPIGEMELLILEKELEEFSIQNKSIMTFSLNFLSRIMKANPFIEKMVIELKNNRPLKFIFDIIGGGKLYCFLAPRVNRGDFVDDFDDL